MIHKMFVIYDSKAKAYLQPWFLPNEEMAQRAFGDCVNEKNHNFARHPDDYTLFHIGEYDDQTAQTETHAPHTLGNGLVYCNNLTAEQQKDLLLDPDINEKLNTHHTQAFDPSD